MSRKRRIFDIDMPDEAGAEAGPKVRSLDAPAKRRGPMASAISENAGALSERAVAEAKIREENDSLAHEYVALKRAGQVIRAISPDDVVMETLVRDRKQGHDPELAELVTSIQEVGLSNPIRVEERADGKYDLIQGYRRLSAYRALAEDSPGWATIPAVILPRGEGHAALYRQMVDENLVRKDISFAEMAMTAQAYAADPNTKPTHVDGAVKELFKSANYQRRSYIRAFARMLDLIGPVLFFPEEISRNLGLALNKRIEDDSSVVRVIKERLAGWENRSVHDELEVLRQIAGGEEAVEAVVKPAAKAAVKGDTGRKPRTTFEVGKGRNKVRCVAGVGQLTLKLDRDLTAVDRKKLEHGIARLLDSLD